MTCSSPPTYLYVLFSYLPPPAFLPSCSISIPYSSFSFPFSFTPHSPRMYEDIEEESPDLHAFVWPVYKHTVSRHGTVGCHLPTLHCIEHEETNLKRENRACVRNVPERVIAHLKHACAASNPFLFTLYLNKIGLSHTSQIKYGYFI